MPIPLPVFDLALAISPLVHAYCHAHTNADYFKTVTKMLCEKILPACKRSNSKAAGHWPVKTAEFLENVMFEMRSKGIGSDLDHHVEPSAAALFSSDAAPIRYTSPPSHSILIGCPFISITNGCLSHVKYYGASTQRRHTRCKPPSSAPSTARAAPLRCCRSILLHTRFNMRSSRFS